MTSDIDKPPAGRSAGLDPARARVVLDPAAIDRALTRIAHEILERTHGAHDAVILGIPTRGAVLAERIAGKIGSFEGTAVPVGTLDVTMYRDDLRLKPVRALARTSIPAGGIDGRLVILVDDVLFSGRTIRAALDALGDIGRPAIVQLAVLVDRGHRQLPIRADYVGKNLPTAQSEAVEVHLDQSDGREAVLLGTRGLPGNTGSADSSSADGNHAGSNNSGSNNADTDTAIVGNAGNAAAAPNTSGDQGMRAGK